MTFARLACGVTVALLALGALVLQAGCSANKSVLAFASPIEKEFAAAAVTWDLDQNGDVTCEEWKQYASGLFREADVNRDGFLSREEFAAMGRRDRLFETAGFAHFDANGDGRIALAEIVDKPNPAFTLLDMNQDCAITPEERMGKGGDGPSGQSKGKLGR